jgi:hypothetical protein
VTEEGVAQVMRIFLRHAAGVEGPGELPAIAAVREDDFSRGMADWVETMCDEAMLDQDG